MQRLDNNNGNNSSSNSNNINNVESQASRAKEEEEEVGILGGVKVKVKVQMYMTIWDILKDRLRCFVLSALVPAAVRE